MVCRACDCHVRPGEGRCPHCGADLAVAGGGARSPRRGSLQVRRVFFATALAGIGVASCGGRVFGDSGATEVAGEAQIKGGCFGLNGSAGTCGYTSDTCQCGVAGECNNGACTPKSCETGEYLNSSGECDSIYWFEPLPSSQSCYGSPPLLG